MTNQLLEDEEVMDPDRKTPNLKWMYMEGKVLEKPKFMIIPTPEDEKMITQGIDEAAEKIKGEMDERAMRKTKKNFYATNGVTYFGKRGEREMLMNESDDSALNLF